MTILDIMNLVNSELGNQFDKFGNQESKSILEWNAIIIEEFLEIEKEINDINNYTTNLNNPNNLKNEIIQTITCLCQLYKKLE